MVVDILIGLQERSPLKYSIVRNASVISSVSMVSKKGECVLKFQGLVDVLFKKKRLQNRLIIANSSTMNSLRMFNSNTKKMSLGLVT